MTEEMSQLPMGWLNALAPLKVSWRVVTDDTSYPLISSLKDFLPLKARDISVTADVFQSRMCPYRRVAFDSSENQRLTAIWKLASVRGDAFSETGREIPERKKIAARKTLPALIVILFRREKYDTLILF